jgi:iron complex transport system substrate-binding protein
MVLLTTGCVNKQAAHLGKGAASYRLTDSKGHIVQVVAKPQRIVSLGISMDEILIDLVPAQRIAALSYLADDSTISNIVDKAWQVPKRVTADAEVIIYLQPDLVLVPDWQPVELIHILRDAGIPVYVYQAPNTIEEIKQVIAETAGITGEEEAGARIIAGMDAELAAIASKIKQVPLDERQVVIRYGTTGVSGGQGSTFDSICRYAGVLNGAALAGLGMNGQLSKEQLVKVNPDVFLLPIWDRSKTISDMTQFKADILLDPALRDIKAIREHRLVNVPDTHMYCASQYVVYGVSDVARAAYPQYFRQP